MGKQLLHTPEGVRDIYGEEYEKKLSLYKKYVSLYNLCEKNTDASRFFRALIRLKQEGFL